MNFSLEHFSQRYVSEFSCYMDKKKKTFADNLMVFEFARTYYSSFMSQTAQQHIFHSILYAPNKLHLSFELIAT